MKQWIAEKLSAQGFVAEGLPSKYIGGEGEHLVFFHANGFPPAMYQQMLQPLTDEYKVSAVYQRPLWPLPVPDDFDNWRLMIDDACRFVAAQPEPITLVGHSMGGLISLICAVREPEKVKQLILLDPVILAPHMIWVMRNLPYCLRKRLPLVEKTLRRQNTFANIQQGFDFHRKVRGFKNISDSVLADYMAEGLYETDDGFKLSYSREWEATIYQTIPWAWSSIKSLTTDTVVFRGHDSDTLSIESVARLLREQPRIKLVEVAGGHLFPLEQPLQTAELIRQHLATNKH